MSHNSETKNANDNKDLIRLERFRQQLSGDRSAWGFSPVEPAIGERRDFLIREKSCGSLRLLGEAEAGSAGKQPRQGIAESKRRSDVGADLVISIPGPLILSRGSSDGSAARSGLNIDRIPLD